MAKSDPLSLPFWRSQLDQLRRQQNREQPAQIPLELPLPLPDPPRPSSVEDAEPSRVIVIDM